MSKTEDGFLFGADIVRELITLGSPGKIISWDLLFQWLETHSPAPPAPYVPPTGGFVKPTGPFRWLQGPLSRLSIFDKLSAVHPLPADVYSDWLVANVVQDIPNVRNTREFGYASYNEPPGLSRTRLLYIKPGEMPSGLHLPEWCARCYAFDMQVMGAPVHLSVTAAPLSGKSTMSPNLQVVITDGHQVIEIRRSVTGIMDTVIDTSYQWIPLIRKGIRDVFVIFATQDAGVSYSISLT